ncbi:RING/U-box superfamily protein [Perilla frutescens var. hirtella]|uniref:RING-type E3 ubiquitin transferase n=1 Tax=Perilla frutescens var. hirtella TaxID=608512 RepID=A0AAD4JIC1_PERFH|nr:RING/U-box superfamily protein [Perilla frutescens var. hirtella]
MNSVPERPARFYGAAEAEIVRNSISEQETGGNNGSGSSNCCSTASSQLKIYQAFIFSVPIFFTFILLFFFYWFYLRRRRADWSSLRMRANNSVLCELGLKKELREMLPILVFNESFSVKDTLCSVCLGEYQAEDRLQQIPACGHTFHMDCIDLWLTTHTTCPLCRQSLLASSSNGASNVDEASHDQTNEEDPQSSEPPSEGGEGDERAVSADARCDCDEAERGVEAAKP